MKSKFLFAFLSITAVFACLMCSISCSSDEQPVSESNDFDSEYTKLYQALEIYTAEFKSTHKCEPQSRILGWDKFKKALKADHVGFSAEGSWVGSISDSRKMWKELKRKEIQERIEEALPPENLSEDEKVMLSHQIDSLKNVYLSDTTNIGAIHNASILQSLIDDDFEFETTKELVESVVASVKKMGIDIEDIDVNKVANEVDDFFENIYDDSIELMYKRLSERYPDRAAGYRLLSHYLSTIEALTSVEDMIEYTDGYVELLDECDLPLEFTGRIRKNLTIAPGSYHLWKGVEELKPLEP
ncbi:MAG: hypothetical protein HDR49_03295 [Bacteroides sp.]|nr:hypothetical protein [Bacteroides sp.]